MKNCLKLMVKILSISCISLSIVPNNVMARGEPPPVGQPAPIDYNMASGWIVLPNVKYEGDNLYECSFNIWSSKNDCSNEAHDPQKVVTQKMGKGYAVSGISPFLGSSGNQLGIVLYYKRTGEYN